MANPDFQLSDLQNALVKEKNTKQLTNISDNFYKQMRDYLNYLEEQIEEIGFPSNSREEMLQRQYRRAKNIADELFNRRSQKILLAAVHKVGGGGQPHTDRMTVRERDFYREITMKLKELREGVFFGGYKRVVKEESNKEDKKEKEKLIEKEASNDNENDTSDISKDEVSDFDELNAQEDIRKEGINHEDDFDLEEVLIHIIEEVPPFIDIDTSYSLKKEDVVTLREDIANVLIERGKARKIKLE
ncbi:MAG: hypothetical protein ACOC85_00710 [Thermoplasmatota archaeon]